jgi:hypothetical protein
MDTKDLSVDKKEENSSLMQQDVASPIAVPVLSAGRPQEITLDQPPDIRPVSDALPEPESVVEDSSKKKRTFVSAGEHFDHWSKYLTIDWVWNAASSACFAYWGKFTNLGQKVWSRPLDKGFTFILKPMFKDPENLREGVRWGNTFSSIIMGGLMFTIPPLLVLENKNVKLKIVKFYDGLFYGKDKVENDPKFQQAYEEIENAPKKGFLANFISRYIALAPLLASVIYKPSRKWLSANVFRHVATGTKAISPKIGVTAEKLFRKFPGAERMKRWNYVHDEAIAMDLSFGLPYAVMHAFFYNMLANVFAGRKTKESSDNNAAEVKSESAQTATASPTVVAENNKKWTDETLRSEKNKLAANFVDKVSDNTLREAQIV